MPLIVTVVFHEDTLGLLNQAASFVLKGNGRTRSLADMVSLSVVGGTALQGVEASMWAIAFGLLGALPDQKSVMLYSLDATTSGNVCLSLQSRW